jgi:SSS family solute:Na+ symporter
VLIFTLYFLVILVFTFLQNKEWYNSVFKANKKVSWIISGISLFMLYLSVDQGQFLTGIIAEYGMKGMWLVWSSWIGVFVIPIVFAPLWQKLNFITDNQFILFRYPGKSGRVLHLFRAIYVGGLVVSLLLCFHVLGFSRVVQIYFNIDETNAILLTGIILALYSLKNVFALKLRTDTFHALIYFTGMVVIILSVWNAADGWDGLFTFFEKNPDKKSILPAQSDTNTWFSLIVFLGIQWWSSYLFDGGGPEMSRFTAVNNKKSALFTGLLPIAISFILGFFILGHIIMLLGLNPNQNSQEIFYVKSVFEIIPEVFKPLVLLAFFGMFISTAESLLNWGASFLTIDAYKQYLTPSASDKSIRIISFLAMFILSATSTIFALEVDSLQSVVKITFSIAAGVAPVYILRWVWYRINAWSQLSAMLSSAAFTLVYPNIHAYFPLSQFPMEESRIVMVTLFTSLIWLLITFITLDQRTEVQQKMLSIVGEKRLFLKRFVIAISLGISFLVFVALVWYALLK